MKLNHESYEKAFSNITLDDRIGMELVSDAKAARLHKKKKIMSQVAAAIICLVLAGGAGTGICYARTGTDPIHFFAMMFQHASVKAVEQLADGFVESDQVLMDGNVKVTLDSYLYDKEKGIIISNVTFATIDGSDFYTKDEMDAYRAGGENPGETDDEILKSMFLGNFGVASGSSANTASHAIVIENGHTFHYYAIITDMNGRKNTSDQLVIRGNNEAGVIGVFKLEPTGTIKAIDLNVENIAACDTAQITGSYLKICWNADTTVDVSTDPLEQLPFSKVEVTLKDGTIYRYQKPDPAWTKKGDYTMDQEEQAYYAEEDGIIKIFSGSVMMDNDQSDWLMRFPDFINVEDIVSVTLDGQEILE
ncbi:DUF4179 domain-containing protein [uncultured Eubacterium sp.]|uniref:DUF4179 domain-containing protein n=1 Tax=uncultured Eubacterium sp. TaxID=165185 RepID=UPI0025F17C64|nr:DUF4179 domain-containing protein [uncultured Eubacterium sp.]